MKFVISRELTDLNSYIKAERTSRYMAAKIKREETEFVYWEIIGQKPSLVSKPVTISFTWYTETRRKDPDNVAFAKKFILDGLVRAGVLEDDSRKWIKRFGGDDFVTDKDNPRVEIELK